MRFSVHKPPGASNVLLKVSNLESYAVLDDGSERTILLHSAVLNLHSAELNGSSDVLPLRTVQQDLQVLHRAAVSIQLSAAPQPRKVYHIKGAFTTCTS